MSSENNCLHVAELPWGAVKVVSTNLQPDGNASMLVGKSAVLTLLVDFFALAERKITTVAQEPIDMTREGRDSKATLPKFLGRGVDSQFDNVVHALNTVSEHCLSSVLRAVAQWYDQLQRRHAAAAPLHAKKQLPAKQTAKGVLTETRDYVVEKKLLAVDYIYCLALIETLPQLYLHPGHDELIQQILNLAFTHFRHRDAAQWGPNLANADCVADMWGEVVGVLGTGRFAAVRRRFTSELNELKHEKDTQLAQQNTIALLTAMRFCRIKTNNLEDLELGISFLNELGVFFLDVKDRDVKHHVAGLLVEILSPFAAQVKTETNVPSLINFVELLYQHTLDLSSKRKHQLAIFPLTTCLLCISQNKFFLNNWHYFLTLTLSNLKSRDPKLARVAIECLYRLVWVYVIRIGCESNSATHSRLQSICNSLFPKGGRTIVPREAALYHFVKIIHFISQGKLDFAIKEIIFDLLCANRPMRTIYAERMNVGLRALMVIADGLQQKEGPPAMPRSAGQMASGTIQRTKKVYLTRPLTEDIARNIGLDMYYAPCRRAFDSILRALDREVARPLMLCSASVQGKDMDELLSGDRKPKLDLMRTCVAAIPRLLPDGMSAGDLVDLLARLTVHVDADLRESACTALQKLMADCGEMRHDVVHGLLQFVTRDIGDNYPQLLEHSLRLLLQLVATWKGVAASPQNKAGDAAEACAGGNNFVRRDASHSAPSECSPRDRAWSLHTAAGAKLGAKSSPLLCGNESALALHCVEGLALVALCHCSAQARKLAVAILREVKATAPLLCKNDHYERPLLDVLDAATPYVLQKYMQNIASADKYPWLGAGTAADFAFAVDRLPQLRMDAALSEPDMGVEYMRWDTWAVALSGYTEPQFLLRHCPSACAYAWPLLYTRLNAVFPYVDPSNPQNDSRGSLLRSSKSKSTAAALVSETLNYSGYLGLWQKYLVVTCALAPPTLNAPVLVRSASPLNVAAAEHAAALFSTSGTASASSSTGETLNSVNTWLSSVTGSAVSSVSRMTQLDVRVPRVASASASTLFRWLVPLLRCDMDDTKDNVVMGLGSVNAASFDCLLEELLSLLREAGDKKGEGVRRDKRRRRDKLRLQLIRLFEVAAFRNTFVNAHVAKCFKRRCTLDANGQLRPSILEFVDNARQFLESDQDRDKTIFKSMRLHFAKMISLLIGNFSDLETLNESAIAVERRGRLVPTAQRQHLFFLFTGWCSLLGVEMDRKHGGAHCLGQYEQLSVSAACSVICAGPVWDAHRTIGDEQGFVYCWLDALTAYPRQRLRSIAEYTLVLLLDLNADTPQMLEWAIDRCYTTGASVADQFLRALASVLSQRDYPCESVQVLVLALLYCGYPVADMQRLAAQLLQLLEHKFVRDMMGASGDISHGLEVNEQPEMNNATVGIAGSPASIAAVVDVDALSARASQLVLSQHLAEAHPQLTMSIISEVSVRLDSARPARQASLLRLVRPWLHNIELVDANLQDAGRPAPSLSLRAKATESRAVQKRVLKGEGWGSAPASEMVLNNLMYITATFGNEHGSLVEELWAALVSVWPHNMRVLLQYLFVMATISPEVLLPLAKRIVVYLARVNSERLVEELINELQMVDTFRWPLERTENAPYYRWLKKIDEYDGKVQAAVEERQGTIHTRRHTPSDAAHALAEHLFVAPGCDRMASADSDDSDEEEHEDKALPPADSGSEPAAAAGQPTAESRSADGDPAAGQHSAAACATLGYTSGDTSASCASLVTLKADIWNHAGKPNGPVAEKAADQSTPHKSTCGGGKEAGGGEQPGAAEAAPPAARRHRPEWLHPFQLPMPAYGGHYCPLFNYLPESNSGQNNNMIVPIYRSNLAVLLLADVVRSDVDIDWTVHLPLMLHMAVLGVDSSRPLIHEHCKQLLLNVLLLHVEPLVGHRRLAGLLLGSNPLVPSVVLHQSNTSGAGGGVSSTGTNEQQSQHHEHQHEGAPSVATTRYDADYSADNGHMADTSSSAQPERKPVQCALTTGADQFDSAVDLATAVVQALAANTAKPLWQSEEVTPRCWHIASAQKLATFVENLAAVLANLVPAARIEPRWAQTALHVALCSSNRHYAGRSFQIFRALRVAPTNRMLSDILSRLVETVGEQTDDMLQGYVTEILLTLDVAVNYLEWAEHSSVGADAFTPDPGAAGDPHKSGAGGGDKAGGDEAPSPPAGRPSSYGEEKLVRMNRLHAARGKASVHARSTSYTAGNLRQRASPAVDRKEVRVSACIEEHSLAGWQRANGLGCVPSLPRSKSAQVLSTVPEGQEEHLNAMGQLLWIAASLLESDLEHEFILAQHILAKLVEMPECECRECLERLERMVKQLNWPKFPGLAALALKGVVSPPGAHESTLELVAKLTPLLDQCMVDTSIGAAAGEGGAEPRGNALALVVVACLPYMLAHFDRPNEHCVAVATAVAQYCSARAAAATTCMEEAQRECGADDATGGSAARADEHPLALLATVMRLYSTVAFSRDSLQWVRCCVKYLHDAGYFCDTAPILMLMVEMLERCVPSLQLPILHVVYCIFQHVQLNPCEGGAAAAKGQQLSPAAAAAVNVEVIDAVAKHVHGAHSREAVRVLKLAVSRSSTFGAADGNGLPLPGRTMEFCMDVSEAGRSQLASNDNGADSPRKQAAVADAAANPNAATLRRYSPNHVRVRGHLVSLLNASGLSVSVAGGLASGGLPKSPSVIFSASSHDLALGEVTAGQMALNQGLGGAGSSIYSSSGELTAGGAGVDRSASPVASIDATGTNTDSFPRVFKEFDFLEAEHDSVSESAESCFNWLSTNLRPRSISNADENENEAEQQQQHGAAAGRAEAAGVGASGGSAAQRRRRSTIDTVRTGMDESSLATIQMRNALADQLEHGVDEVTRRRTGSRTTTTASLSVRDSLASTVSSLDCAPVAGTVPSVATGVIVEDERRSDDELLDEDELEEEDELLEGATGLRPSTRGSPTTGDRSTCASPPETDLHAEGASQHDGSAHARDMREGSESACDGSLGNSLALSPAPPAIDAHDDAPPPHHHNDDDAKSGAGLSTTDDAVPPASAQSGGAAQQRGQRGQFLSMPGPSSVLSETTSKTGDGCDTVDEEADTRPATPLSCSASRLSLCGSVGTPGAEIALPIFNLECTHHATGQVDDAWLLAVADLTNDGEGYVTANATLIFTQLFKESCAKVQSLLRDSCHYLSMAGDSMRPLAAQFLQVLDVLMRMYDCPFLFVTAPLLRTANMLQTQKLFIFELREHYETFQERREHCIRTLNSVKSNLKLQFLGQKVDGLPEKGTELCHSLHKLFFQLALMCECFEKMVQRYTLRSFPAHVSNLCADVRRLHRELLCSVSEVAAQGGLHGSGYTPGLAPDLAAAIAAATGGSAAGGAGGRNSQPVGVLVKLLNAGYVKEALKHLRHFRRQQNRLDIYGCCDEQDVEVMLLLYCRHLAQDTNPSSFAVLGNEDSFWDSVQSLLEANLRLSATVRRVRTCAATGPGSSVGGASAADSQGRQLRLAQGAGQAQTHGSHSSAAANHTG